MIMNKNIYLPELDSVRKSDWESLKAEQALFNELVLNGNNVILSFNQLTDSKCFIDLISRDNNLPYILDLFKKGFIKVSNYKDLRTASQYIQNAIDRYLDNNNEQAKENTFIFSWLTHYLNESKNETDVRKQKAILHLLKRALYYSDPSLIDLYKNYFTDFNVEKIKSYISFIITISCSPYGNNSPKSEEFFSYKFYSNNNDTQGLMNIVIDNLHNRNYQKLCDVIDNCLSLTNSNLTFQDVLHELLNIRNSIHDNKIISNRSVWLDHLKINMLASNIEIDNMPNSILCVKALTEIIIHYCYNYVIEDSIYNINKSYQESENNNLLIDDFCHKISLFWEEYINYEHNLEVCGVYNGHTNLLRKPKPEEYPDWSVAVRLLEAHNRPVKSHFFNFSFIFSFSRFLLILKNSYATILESTTIFITALQYIISNYLFICKNQRKLEAQEDDTISWKRSVNKLIAKKFLVFFSYILFFCFVNNIIDILPDIINAVINSFVMILDDFTINTRSLFISNTLNAFTSWLEAFHFNESSSSFNWSFFNSFWKQILFSFLFVAILCEIVESFIYEKFGYADVVSSLRGIKQNYKDILELKKANHANEKHTKKIFNPRISLPMNSTSLLGKEWSNYTELYEKHKDMLFINANIIYNIVLPESNKKYIPIDGTELDAPTLTAKELVERFQLVTGKRIGVVYESDYNILVVDLVYQIPGNYFTYERIIPKNHSGGVVILAFHNQNIIFLKQFRHATRDFEYSLIRGFSEKDKSDLEVVTQELKEEIGATIIGFPKLLGKVTIDSGLCGKKVAIYACHIDSYNPTTSDYEGIVSVYEKSPIEFEKMISNNTITDNFTIEAYCLWKLQNT